MLPPAPPERNPDTCVYTYIRVHVHVYVSTVYMYMYCKSGNFHLKISSPMALYDKVNYTKYTVKIIIKACNYYACTCIIDSDKN